MELQFRVLQQKRKSNYFSLFPSLRYLRRFEGSLHQSPKQQQASSNVKQADKQYNLLAGLVCYCFFFLLLNFSLLQPYSSIHLGGGLALAKRVAYVSTTYASTDHIFRVWEAAAAAREKVA